MPAFCRIGLAALSGWLLYFSYEPHGLWYAGVAGLAVFVLALIPWRRRVTAALGMAGEAQKRPSAAFGALLGIIQALVCYLFLLPWVGEFVGAMPFIALSVFLSLYGALTGAFGVLVTRLPYGFAAFALVYCAVELLRSSFPFGGFAWVRAAWGQIDGPLAALASWGGPALVTFAVATVGAGLVGVVADGNAGATRWAQRAIGAACVVVPLIAAFAAGGTALRGAGGTGDGSTGDNGTARVAAVQGNVPRMGLDFNAQRRAVLANHVEETERLAADANAEGKPLDLVIWPENASDVNPFTDTEAGAMVADAARSAGAPVLVGTVTRDEVGARNTMVVITPDGQVGDHHYKRFLQPFGEYMPMRDFFRHFSELVDLAGDFKPGTDDGVVRMGNVAVGVATCYEVAEDQAYRGAVRAGAEILATPTNNATFGFTGMTYQQLAMSRMRAIELDRPVVIAATSGVSAIVHSDGSVSQQTEIFTPDHLAEDLPRNTSLTPAVRLAQPIQWLLATAGATAALGALLAARRGYAATRARARGSRSPVE